MEEAEAYQRLLAEFGWTQEELAQRVGKDRSSIANCLRLLKLPELIQADLRAGRLTMGHARALLSLASPAEQLRLREEILAHSWSVRATEEGVQARAREAASPRSSAARPSWPRSKTRSARRSPRACVSSATSARAGSRSPTPRARTSTDSTELITTRAAVRSRAHARADRRRAERRRRLLRRRRAPRRAGLRRGRRHAARLAVARAGGRDEALRQLLLARDGGRRARRSRGASASRTTS